MIPEAIRSNLEEFLGQKLTDMQSVSGGDINSAAIIKTADAKRFFLKWNEQAPEDMFEKEARGLRLLAGAETGLIIPEAVHATETCLLMSVIQEGGGNPDSAYQFGRNLALLHKASADSFGLDHDNYIGRLPQSNNRHGNWFDFFAIERIEPQIQTGIESGKLNRKVLMQVQSLYKKLGNIMPAEAPSLLHGDLWSGNYMFTREGGCSIYDPAVYYGHREADLAMTRLFGGFSAGFYKGYTEEFPPEPGFEERVTLFNLYPVLVHANLFGGSYIRQAESIIEQYA